MRIVVYLPIRTRSEANAREHWGTKAKRVKSQRTDAYLVVANRLRGALARGDRVNRVVLVRIAPRSLDAGDNLPAALKAIRDGVADALGINDGDGSIAWQYRQVRGAVREYAVLVEIETV